MSDKLSGYTEVTPHNLVTGAAVVYVDFDIDTDTAATAADKVLSATSGGVTVTVEWPDAWDFELDNVPANSVGLREPEYVRPTVEFTAAEIGSASALARALGGATTTDSTAPAGYKIVQPRDLTAADYAKNLTLIARTKTGNLPVIIQILNPLSTEGLELTTTPKGQAGMGLTFTGNFDPLKLSDMPIKFYVPSAAV